MTSLNGDKNVPPNDSEDWLENSETIDLTDESGRSLLCYLEKSVEIEGREYLLLFPVDSPVQIFAWDDEADEDEDEESLYDIDPSEIETIFDTARAVMSEQNLTLQKTALTLTVRGDLPEPEEEDLVTLNLEWDDQAEADEETFQILSTFYYGEQKYMLCTPVDSLPILARISDDDQLKVLEPEEYDLIRAELEDKLFEDLED